MNLNKKMLTPIIGGLLILGIVVLTLFNLRSNEEFEIKFNTDGADTIESQLIQKNGKIEKPADPVKEGYEFLGWYNGDEEWDFENKITENITLTAKWKKIELKSYKVTFNPNGGSSIDPVEIEEGQKLDFPADPVRSGYIFLGWFIDGEKYDFETLITSDIELIAMWERISSTGQEQSNDPEKEDEAIERNKLNSVIKELQNIVITEGSQLLPTEVNSCEVTWNDLDKIETIYRGKNDDSVKLSTTINCKDETENYDVNLTIKASNYNYTVKAVQPVIVMTHRFDVVGATGYDLGKIDNGNFIKIGQYSENLGYAQVTDVSYEENAIYAIKFDDKTIYELIK